ncbi:DUF58 domain-containing protein [uncultured Jatrophihabitans sp.]|uniref:DUF58 domain-containing protein n=1 Tax=uncultured Jatrophihabitans sp. TaxID=1610747 RepID=UPI0035CAF00A
MSEPADHGPRLDLHEGDALLRRLELTVRNKLDGLLQGNYLGLVPGPGSEAGESRPYVPGDDVRRMDWAVTARTTVPHLRQTIADRELETWLVVDLSASMDFGTARAEKRELVLAAITAIVQLTVRGGNRVGAIVGNGAQSFVIPALGGHIHARQLVRQVAGTPRVDGAGGRGGERGGHDLADLLEQLRRPQRRRGLVAVVSDFVDSVPSDEPPTWERPLRALAARHQLLGVEILDPRELELAAAGLVTFVDTETGRQLEVQTDDAAVRQRYAAAAQAQRARIATALRHAGSAHLQLRTDRDWVSDVVRFVIARRQLVSGARGAGVS